ncbi:MAG: hypothetical protein ACFB4J_12430 [Elainellaceae cyanobacterium]
MTHNHDAELLEHLLKYYSFELNQITAEQCVAQWRDRYPETWLRSAVVEALYQGRYKAVSVTQILDMWQRRGQSLCHYNGEFERMICSKFLARSFSGVTSRAASVEAKTADPALAPDSQPQSNPYLNGETASMETADESPFSLTEDATLSPPQSAHETQPNAASRSATFDSADPDVSLLEEEFLEVFAAQTDSGSHAIAPFKPSAEVPMAAMRFSHEPTGRGQPDVPEEVTPVARAASIHGFTPTAVTSDLYGKLKAALDRVVSSPTDKT